VEVTFWANTAVGYPPATRRKCKGVHHDTSHIVTLVILVAFPLHYE